jgi:hypothetical protein
MRGAMRRARRVGSSAPLRSGGVTSARAIRSSGGETPTTAHYLTDGTNLYRFVGWIARGRLAELEDCRSLELLVMRARDFATTGLIPVKS